MAFSHIRKFVLRKPSIFFTSLRLTSLCSQNCLQCSIPGQSDGSFISLQDFKIIAPKLYNYGTRILTFTGGEPALHPELEQIFAIARTQDFRALEMLTNLYYSEAHQDKVIALAMKYNIGIHTSFDGLGQVADILRGANEVQATVERGMLKINELRKQGLYKHKPSATVVVSALNIDQLPQIIQRLEELEWNLNIDLYRWGSVNHREDNILKIKDPHQVSWAIAQIRNAKNLRTPLWYYDGLDKVQHGKMKKQCPYLISPTFGSKFFIHENGDLHTCRDSSLGNLVTDEIEAIFHSDSWKNLKNEFADCWGCWNTCYTLSSRALSYLHLGTIKQYLAK